MNELFVCEKPSVARNLATVISGGYKKEQGYYVGNDDRIYVSAFGHLVTCKSPEEINSNWGWKGDVSHLPFFITDIPLKVIDDPGIKKQFDIISNLMKQAENIVIATDAGREGEHIFRKIYQLANADKPLQRMWIQDNTDDGLLKAYGNMKDGKEYEGLALAGRLREESDLLVGLNATQLATKVAGNQKVLSLGRVQTPTLAMIVQRDHLIENFSKETHYTIVAPIKESNIKFELKLEDNDRLDKNRAEIILNMLENRGQLEFDIQSKKEKPKRLFNLTSLQAYMNEKYKWGVKKTLKVTQKLYENRFVTYPRTDSSYIASDADLPKVLEKHKENKLIKTVIDKGYSMESTFVDPSKVSDHEAIIITTNAKTSDLNGDDKVLYAEIFKRFVAAFYPPAVKKVVIARFKDGEHEFQAKETVYTDLGWRALFDERVTEAILESVVLQDVLGYELKEKSTTPPKRYTDGTLVIDMENAGKFLEDKEEKKLLKEIKGIGTVATRADIIEKLLQRGFIENKGQYLNSTSLGRELIAMMPNDFSLYNVKLTAFFESMLNDVENQIINEEIFYKELEGLIKRLSEEIRSNAKIITSVKNEKEVIATCPNCGKSMYENKKGFSCSGFREGCKTTLWKNGLEKLGKKNITKTEAKKLLNGKSVNVKLKSKAGKDYKKEVEFNKEKNWIVLAK